MLGFGHSSFGLRFGIRPKCVGITLNFLGVGIRFSSGGVGLIYYRVSRLVLALRLRFQPLGLFKDFFAIGNKLLTRLLGSIDYPLGDPLTLRLRIDAAGLGERQLVIHR